MAKRVKKGEAGYDVSITRPGPFGNPFIIGIHGTRAECIAQYAEWLPRQPELMTRLPKLRSKVLGCVCRSDQKCHGDVILRLISELDMPKPWCNLSEAERKKIELLIPLGLVEVSCPWWPKNHWESKTCGEMFDDATYRVKLRNDSAHV